MMEGYIKRMYTFWQEAIGMHQGHFWCSFSFPLELYIGFPRYFSHCGSELDEMYELGDLDGGYY